MTGRVATTRRGAWRHDAPEHGPLRRGRVRLRPRRRRGPARCAFPWQETGTPRLQVMGNRTRRRGEHDVTLFRGAGRHPKRPSRLERLLADFNRDIDAERTRKPEPMPPRPPECRSPAPQITWMG